MVPWFQRLDQVPALDVNVVFLRQPTAHQQGVGFGQSFTWDVPLRDGYRSSVLAIDKRIGDSPTALKRIHDILSDSKPDVVLITGWNEPVLALCYPLLKLMRVPVILRGESNDLRKRGLFAKLFHRLMAHLVNGVVIIGAANRRFYLDNGFPDRKIFPGTYFVDSERMLEMAAANEKQRVSERAQHLFAPSDFVFAFVGKHVAFKRPMMLVEAAAICNAHNVPVKLLFAGSGELTGQLRKNALALGVEAKFTGFLNQSEMWKAYVPADAFVLPSDCGETWGLVTNEAMLFGLPVIVSTTVGCAEDLVIDGETGYTFRGGADELAQRMMQLSANRSRSAAMGRNGRERVKALYSMPVATDGLLQAIASVVPQFAQARHA